ncbi:putative phospholipid-transporting P-type ATPase [Neospora caninum Liverpool]|uniref:Phospholipid-transporting P-type ATPase,putative n=1 Tax=Neospora caninum (strain Liverpool) TaxID=572307 RepID=F0VH70_NEOCL|nr:putative phospholipid-transporting P-type ATPase [Neospora caninum Liverpool]CBZ53064.1 putative phospholipid-transporting P-type ATPase [Neospora caninum Liverpool]CEL67047.1 TPA: phospholipid-transporting P-type ATPase,putative [Neospora caninum Liverpool]|eukprot:XP_003883096.1 putative phospholipid-transporting P-type ATPase [Neospora caninum Liverpool]
MAVSGQAEAAADRGVLANLLCLPFDIWWRSRQKRRNEYVFFLTNYNFHEDGAIRERLLEGPRQEVDDETDGEGNRAGDREATRSLDTHPDVSGERRRDTRQYRSALLRQRVHAPVHHVGDSHVSFLRGSRPANEIHTAKYTKVTFVPLVLFYQLTRFSNFYFLCVAMLQLLPAISDSGGVPTYLIPISIIVGLSVIKEFFEDYSRHKSDEEENAKQVLVFESGKLVEKQWREVRVGDVVKITAGQQFPADLVLLNCAHDFGICNVETKNVDGESNVKSRFCLPKLTRIFADDKTAGTAKVRFICEPACDNLTSFNGKVILPPLSNREPDENDERHRNLIPSSRHRSSRSGSTARSTTGLHQQQADAATERVCGGPGASRAVHDTDGAGGRRMLREGQLPQMESNSLGKGEAWNSPKQRPGSSYRASRFSALDAAPDPESAVLSEQAVIDPHLESEGSEERPKELTGVGIVGTGEADGEEREGSRRESRRQEAPEIQAGRGTHNPSADDPRPAVEAPDRRGQGTEEEIALSVNQLLLRGTSMVETKWAYGAVVYAGRQTRLMMNSRVGAVQKWSRLELNYSSHVVVMILVQVLSVLLLSFMSIYWIETQGYRATYLDLRSYVSTIKNFGLTFGATFLVFASFVPLDLFMLWEICRFVQGLFINFDEEMYSAEAERHALSQAAQLIEEMGNVTHVYSDKTGTLTKNLMQLKCLGLGDGFEYGMDLWCDDRAEMNVADRKFQKQMHQLKAEARRRGAVSRRLAQQAASTSACLGMPWPVSGGPGVAPDDHQGHAGARGFGKGVPSPCVSTDRFCHSEFGGTAGDAWSETGATAQDSSDAVSRTPSRSRWPLKDRGPRGATGGPRRGGTESDLSQRQGGAASSSSGPPQAEEVLSRVGFSRHQARESGLESRSSPLFPGGALRPTVCHPIFLREANSFVSLDRVELARSLLQAPPKVVDCARHLFLIMGICHTVLVREKRRDQREESEPAGPPSLLERVASQPLLADLVPRRNSLDGEGGDGKRGGSRLRGASEQRYRRRKRRRGIGSAAVAALSSCAGGGGQALRKVSRPRLRRSQTISIGDKMEHQTRGEGEDGVPGRDAFAPDPRRTEWVDEASGFAFREFDEAPPQYDASSPDELCLISACNYFGLEFAARPSLMDVELELTSSFMVELLLGWKREVEARKTDRERGREAESAGGRSLPEDERSGLEFTEMTRRLIVKQLERAQRLVAGPRSTKAGSPPAPSVPDSCPEASESASAAAPTARAGGEGTEDKGAQDGRETWSRALSSAVASVEKSQAKEAGSQASDKRRVSRSAVPFLSFELLDVLEFDNDRKRMSVITRGFDGRVLLLCKGADTQMIEVAARGQEKHLAVINAQLHGFASSGLRTLVFGYRYLPPELYSEFHGRFTQAQQLLGEEHEKAVADCLAMVERDLLLVGCSGIEDRLQDDVQGTIKDLKAAGMKVWVLTGTLASTLGFASVGDKLETAINIGHSTNLISDKAYNAIIDADSKDAIAEQLTRHERHCHMANLLDQKGGDVRDSQWWAEIDWGDLGMDPEEDEEVRELLDKQMSKTYRTECSRGEGAYPGSSTENASMDLPPQPEATDPTLFPDLSHKDHRQGNAPLSTPGSGCGSATDAGDLDAEEGRGNARNETTALLLKDSPPGSTRVTRVSNAKDVEDRSSPTGRGTLRAPGTFHVATVRSRSETQVEARDLPPVPKGDSAGTAGLGTPGSGQEEVSSQGGAEQVAGVALQSSPSAPAAGGGAKHGGKQHGKRQSVAWRAAKRIRGGFAGFLNSKQPGASGDLCSDESGTDCMTQSRGVRGVPCFSGLGGDVRFREFSEFCMTVTGSALAVIMQDRFLKVKFYSLARHASTLIASRVTPKHKALLLRQNSAFNPRGTSLAIGDGANDVAMILAASVGVGISGREGLQAARAADFSIGEFRLLRKLLFVHGREALRRNCILVYVCIFRNAVMCWCTLAMNFLCGFSGLDVWNPWTKQVVSLAFTCLPILGFVTLDRQVPHKVLLDNPVLYEIIPSTLWPYYTSQRAVQARQWLQYLVLDPAARACRAVGMLLVWPFARWCHRIDLSLLYAWFQHRKKPENDRCYGTHCLLIWLAFALWVAVFQLTFTIYSVVGAWTPSVNRSHGFTSLQLDSFSHVMELAYIIIVNGVVAVLSNTWTVVEIVIHVGELAAALLFWVVITYWKLFLNIGGAAMLHGTYVLCSLCAPYYFGLTITVLVCLLPLLVPMAWQMVRKPALEQVLVEQLKLGAYKPVAARRGRPEGVAYVAVESPQMRQETGARGGEDDYKGFAFTHEPVFGVLPALQEAYKALKKTGEGAKVLLRKTQTFIKGGEGSDAKK